MEVLYIWIKQIHRIFKGDDDTWKILWVSSQSCMYEEQVETTFKSHVEVNWQDAPRATLHWLKSANHI